MRAQVPKWVYPAALGLLAIGIGAYLVAQFTPSEVTVRCPTDVFKGKEVTWTFKAINELNGKAIGENVSLYFFSEKPEDWGVYSKVTDLKEKAVKTLEITSKEGVQTTVKIGDQIFLLADGIGYYPEFVELTIPVPQPKVAVPRGLEKDVDYVRSKCLEVYKTAQDALAAAGITPVTEIKMKPAKDLYVESTTVPLRKTDDKYLGARSVQVDFGSMYILDKIVFERGAALNKTKKVIVRINVGGKALEYTIWDASGETTTGLLAETTSKEINEFDGKDVVVLKEGEPITVTVEVVPAEGQTLVSGDEVVRVKLVDADPEEVSPVTLVARVS